jgi:iron complex outermembrane recepter protein
MQTARVLPALLAVGLGTAPAWAQHATDNPLASADDAFGLTLGLESIGLYNPGGVRGFNPQAAGDVRIDGLYFDQQGGLSNRVVEGSTIRVGVSAIGYAFPAPTGIVDYDLRHVGDGTTSTASVVVSGGPFEARGVSLDAVVPLIGRELQVPLGGSYQVSTGTNFGSQPDYTSRFANLGATPAWTPNERVTFRAIIDWSENTQARTVPQIFTAGDYQPPPVQRGYYGQNWALGKGVAENFGGIMLAKLSAHWSLAAGLFRSIGDNPVSYSDLYVNTLPNGVAEHEVVGYPDQRVASNSGEVRLTGHFMVDSWRHEVVLLARGRDTLAMYGGSDSADLGPALISQAVQVPEPTFSYSARTRDDTRLWSVGAAYRVQWDARGELAFGVQQQTYDKEVTTPGLPEARLEDRPLRLYGNAAAAITSRLTAYAGYTQGLEDSGSAPGSAANRGEILPDARTWQVDTGLRFTLTPKLKLIAGVFEIQKPYFNFDTNNVDRQLGLQQARGVELSLSGELAPQLQVSAGLLAGRVAIVGPNLQAEGVGPIAFGQPRLTFVINTDYRLPQLPSVSMDLTVYHFGAAPSSVDNVVYADPVTQYTLGGRYRFTMFGKPATLRLQVQNLTNLYVWNIGSSPGYIQFSPRSVFGYLTADL